MLLESAAALLPPLVVIPAAATAGGSDAELDKINCCPSKTSSNGAPSAVECMPSGCWCDGTAPWWSRPIGARGMNDGPRPEP